MHTHYILKQLSDKFLKISVFLGFSLWMFLLLSLLLAVVSNSRKVDSQQCGTLVGGEDCRNGIIALSFLLPDEKR